MNTRTDAALSPVQGDPIGSEVISIADGEKYHLIEPCRVDVYDFFGNVTEDQYQSGGGGE